MRCVHSACAALQGVPLHHACGSHTPCTARRSFTEGPEQIGVKRVASSSKYTLIYRSENVGMDIGSHNVTLEYMLWKRRLW